MKKLYFDCTIIFYRFCSISLDKDEFSDALGMPNLAGDTEEQCHWFVSFSPAEDFSLKEWQISFLSKLQTWELHQRNFWSSCNRSITLRQTENRRVSQTQNDKNNDQI